MNKNVKIGAFAGLVIVLVVVIITLLPKGKNAQKAESGQETSLTEDKVEGRVQPRLALGLDVNWDTEELLSGFPMVFSITLRNLSVEQASRVKHLIDFYSLKASPEEKEMAADSIKRWKEELKGIPSSPLGLRHKEKTVSDWISFEIWEDGQFNPLQWPVKPAVPAEVKELELGKDRIYLEYFIPADKTRDIRPSDYKIRARLSSGLSDSWRDEIVSQEVVFRLIPAEGTSEIILMQNHYVAGYFYLNLPDYTAAEEHAREILLRDSENVKALTLLGRAIEGQGNQEEAQKIYSTALDIFIGRNPGEPPPAFLIKKSSQFLEEKMKKLESR